MVLFQGITWQLETHFFSPMLEGSSLKSWLPIRLVYDKFALLLYNIVLRKNIWFAVIELLFLEVWHDVLNGFLLIYCLEYKLLECLS